MANTEEDKNIPKMTPDEQVASLIHYINDTPALLWLLYDMDLMPEEVEKGGHDWKRMLILASWMREEMRKTELSSNP